MSGFQAPNLLNDKPDLLPFQESEQVLYTNEPCPVPCPVPDLEPCIESCSVPCSEPCLEPCPEKEQCCGRKKHVILGIDITSPIFYTYLFIIIVTAVLLLWLHFGFNPETQNIPNGTPPTTLYLFQWIFSLVVFIFAGYHGYINAAPDYRRQNLLNLALSLNLILAIVWAILFFRMEQPFEALWVMVGLVLVVIWWIYLIWDVSRISAYLLFIHLIFVIYYAYINYDWSQLNP